MNAGMKKKMKKKNTTNQLLGKSLALENAADDKLEAFDKTTGITAK